MDTGQGYDAARAVALTMLAGIRHVLGSLDRIERVVKVLVMASLPAGIPVEVEMVLEVTG